MELKVKGHSGCQVDVVTRGNDVFVIKSTSDPGYLSRLSLQGHKQMAAAKVAHQHIRIPEIYSITETASRTEIRMQYVYSKNFVEAFEQAGFEQIRYLVDSLCAFIDYEVKQSTLVRVPANLFVNKFVDVSSKIKEMSPELMEILKKAKDHFEAMTDPILPVGVCHGDLTFSNILFNGNNYYLIDFLDSFIETPLQDIVKLRQDTSFRWSEMMYTKAYDRIRIKIIFDQLDKELNRRFTSSYAWYREYYQTMQLMNILRIVPYAKNPFVIQRLTAILKTILNEKL